jgi:hypothetical protein
MCIPNHPLICVGNALTTPVQTVLDTLTAGLVCECCKVTILPESGSLVWTYKQATYGPHQTYYQQCERGLPGLLAEHCPRCHASEARSQVTPVTLVPLIQSNHIGQLTGPVRANHCYYSCCSTCTPRATECTDRAGGRRTTHAPASAPCCGIRAQHGTAA